MARFHASSFKCVSLSPTSLRRCRYQDRLVFTQVAERSAKLPGPPARTLKLGKPGWRPRSASAVGSAQIARAYFIWHLLT